MYGHHDNFSEISMRDKRIVPLYISGGVLV